MSSTGLLAKVGLLALAAAPGAIAWPLKIEDFSNGGADCDPSTQKYLQVEAYDFHQYPNVQLTWRQLNGECGAEVAPADRAEWTATYDSVGLNDEAPDDSGRVQLDLWLCAPFGDYELELVVKSSTDDDAPMEFQKRSAWEIENGADEFHIWDSVTTLHGLNTDPAYSPTAPGTYTWPIPGTVGYYSTMYAGPLPPLVCPNKFPARTKYEGCYSDAGSTRAFNQARMRTTGVQGTNGMNTQKCSDYCADYDYFGMSWGYICDCGTEAEFNAASSSTNCGTRYLDLCYGASDETCGGRRALSVYSRDTPSPISPTPSPVSNGEYTSVGCLVDSASSRIMDTGFFSQEPMSAEICSGLCNDGINTHFGTQYFFQCFCGVDTDVSATAPESECSTECSGNEDEFCGGSNRMSTYAYVIAPPPVPTPAPVRDGEYESVGCLVDSAASRIMDAGFFSQEPMSAEICFNLCNDDTNTHFGTQYFYQCFCGVNTDVSGAVSESECDTPCSGNEDEFCGGSNRMSTYTIDGFVISPSPVPAPTPAPTPAPVRDVGYVLPAVCLSDHVSDRLMTAGFFIEEPMSAEICFGLCDDGTNTHFGTQYFSECFCGVNTDVSGAVSDSECNTPCSGNEDEFCGGSYRMSTYTIEATAPSPAPAPVPDVEYESVGCLADSASSRIMDADFFSQEPMSAEICFGLCDDGTSTHFGTQYFFQCFCGVNTDVSGAVSDSECNTPCSGNEDEFCGGSNRMSTYTIEATAPSPAPAPVPDVRYESVGCLVDSEDRIMDAGFFSRRLMSAEICFGLCNDGVNTHFATQYSSECFCGINTDVSSPVDDSECNAFCSGTPAEKCGGDYRSSAYVFV